MATTRRGFLRLAARSLALALAVPDLARAVEKAKSIHRATRNTLTGAIGVRIRRLAGTSTKSNLFPGKVRLALPPPSRDPALALEAALARDEGMFAFDPSPLTFEMIARLLHFTNGVTGSSPGGLRLRAAPSAGALYAGEVYLVAERSSGLAPGVYAFAPLRDQVVLLRPGSFMSEVAESLESPDRARGAAVAMILTNVFARYRQRYANRGYRYALIDSGHIGENLRLTASSAGLLEWAPRRFHDDRMNALLGIDGRNEAVCAVHLVGRPGEIEGVEQAKKIEKEGDLVRHRSFVERRAGPRAPEDVGDAPREYHAYTKLVPAGDSEVTRPLPGQPDLAEPAAGFHHLPARPPPSATVEEMIGIRRSARRFRVAAMRSTDLGYVLEAAAGHAHLERALGIELYVFAHRVAGLGPGLYRAYPRARRLGAQRRGNLVDDLVDACLGQTMAGTAAAGIVMVADLDRAAGAGDRVYRDMLLEAGAVGQRIYLAAEAVGLTARNLAAYVDDDLNALIGVDGRSRGAVHLTMVGPGD